MKTMKTILEIPQTPRMAFEALSGKRPELLLTKTSWKQVGCGTVIVECNANQPRLPKLHLIVSHIGNMGTGDLVAVGGLS